MEIQLLRSEGITRPGGEQACGRQSAAAAPVGLPPKEGEEAMKRMTASGAKVARGFALAGLTLGLMLLAPGATREDVPQ